MINESSVNCIMLVDDNKIDNFFHERIIRKCEAAVHVIAKDSAEEALQHLQDPELIQPEMIFLDINMPGMDGWEFIEEYKKLDASLQKSMVVVMLTTSENPDDLAKARTYGILADFKTKPLTREMLRDVISNYKETKGEP